MTLTFVTDVNFDGVFDERDRAARYDFNDGALVTHLAFSAGNSFPILFREGGAVIIGEPTDGGSCGIQVGANADGLCYVFSSAQWQSTDSRGGDTEGRCAVDLPIEPASDYVVDVLASFIGTFDGVPDFTAYYDDARLDEMMNAWFADQDVTRAAA